MKGRFSLRVEERNNEDADDHGQRNPLRNFQSDEVFRVKVLDDELTPNPRDDDERAVDNRWIFLDQGQQSPDNNPHRNNPKYSPGQNYGDLGRYRDRRQNRVDGKDQ